MGVLVGLVHLEESRDTIKDKKRLGTLDWRVPNQIVIVVLKLLQLNYGTSSLDGLLQVLSLFLRQAFLHSSGSTVNQVLSFLQSKTASLLNGLNDLELSSTCRLQDNVERRLLLSSSSTTSSRTSSYSNGCSSRLNSILVLQDCCQLVYFFYSKVYQLFCNSFNICHFI